MDELSHKPLRIRTARVGDLKALRRLLGKVAPPRRHWPTVFSVDRGRATPGLGEIVLDRCMLLAEQHGAVVALAGIDLDHGSLAHWRIAAPVRDRKVPDRLLAEAERLAVSYGITELQVEAPGQWAAWLDARGYRSSRRGAGRPARFIRSLARRQTKYARQVRAVAEQLGIPADYARRHRLPLQPESSRLVSIGHDLFGREQHLGPAAAAAWGRMCRAAASGGHELMPVSAFRSFSYQQELLHRKLARGLAMDQILRVSAAPGYSEHHTGRAIDITTPGFAVLETEFEDSPAFSWLKENAHVFGFRLSFPRNNRHGLAYEPWHWYFES